MKGLKGARWLLAAICLTNLPALAEDAPMPEGFLKSYPYTYERDEKGYIIPETVCQYAPPSEKRYCRIKARWDFTVLCGHYEFKKANAISFSAKKAYTRFRDIHCGAKAATSIPPE